MTAPMPATENLFKVKYEKDARPLPEKKSAQLYHVVAHILFASGRVRQDLQTEVGFIATIVKALDKGDWGKLKRVMKYTKGTLGVNLTITEDRLSVIKWWVDTSFSTHNNFWGYTGGMMSLGSGAITSVAWKQNINRRSSTNNYLIGVKDMMGTVLWTIYLSRLKDTPWRATSCYKTTTKSCV